MWVCASFEPNGLSLEEVLENNINHILDLHLIVKTIELRWFFDKQLYPQSEFVKNWTIPGKKILTR